MRGNEERPFTLKAALAMVVVVVALCRVGVAAEPRSGDDKAAELATIEAILKQAGAEAPELTRLEDDLRQGSLEDLVQFADYLQHRSPAERSDFVKDMRLNAQYAPGPGSKPQPGVPRGKTFEHRPSARSQSSNKCPQAFAEVASAMPRT